MKVLEAKHVEDCFDGSLIQELLLTEPIREAQIRALGSGGHVQYFAHFSRPFFKIRMSGLYDLKGIEGNTTLRVHLKSPGAFPMEKMITLLETVE